MASTRKPPTKKKPAPKAKAPAKKKPAPKAKAPAKKKPAAKAAPAKKKPAARPAPAKVTASASKAERVYTVDELVKRVGGADESGARALVRGYTDEDLIELGRRVATPRITTDGRRLYGVEG
jgi:outer membrane biosynthesis protein TonB